MFCPECDAEYREGFTECADCKVALVPERVPKESPEPDHDVELETVFDSSNPALLALARSLLDEADIRYVMVGENAGAAFSGNPIFGHVWIQVEASRADDVRELLDDLEESDADDAAARASDETE